METQDNGFLLVIDGVRKEKERLTAAKLFFLSFNPMVLSRLPALVSCFGSISWEGRKDRKPPWKSKKVGSKGLAVPLSISLLQLTYHYISQMTYSWFSLLIKVLIFPVQL